MTRVHSPEAGLIPTEQTAAPVVSGHTIEDYGSPEYLDGAMMQFALANGKGQRTAYVATLDDARRYAAAPDLLEALEAILGQRDLNAARLDSALHLWVHARAAIAKATGEAGQ